MATSKGLKTWVRNPANPILPNGPTGSFDEQFASEPWVLKFKGERTVFYHGLDRKGVDRDLLALSRDMGHVSKCKTELIEPGPQGIVDSIYVHKPSITAHQRTLYHFYRTVSHKFGRGISVAASRPWPKTS